MKASHKLLLIFATTLLLLASCGHRHDSVSRFIDIPSKGWAYNDTLAYYFNPTDSLISGNFSLCIDYAPTYRYRNLWIEISSGIGKGINKRDTLEIAMVDSAGHIIGQGIASNYQIFIDSLTVSQVPQPILLRHIMRTDTLRNINRVGIFFNQQ